jgi:hypothetical protein
MGFTDDEAKGTGHVVFGQKSWLDLILALLDSSKRNPGSVTQSKSKEILKDHVGEEVKFPPSEVKRRWRLEQIRNQNKCNRLIDSTWRQKQMPGIWCGWLQKRNQGILFPWKPPRKLWFELRQGSDSVKDCNSTAVLHCFDSNERSKDYTIISAERDCLHDRKGWRSMSFVVAGRTRRLYLSAIDEYQAQALLSKINTILHIKK